MKHCDYERIAWISPTSNFRLQYIVVFRIFSVSVRFSLCYWISSCRRSLCLPVCRILHPLRF